jgi:hypothetical protein
MTNPDELVENYIAMWNATDPERRRDLIAQTVTDDASYLDPMLTGEGIDGINAMIGGAQAQFPGHLFTLRSGPNVHHDRVYFGWTLAASGGETIAVGTDFATVAEDGRMQSITGFLEPAA